MDETTFNGHLVLHGSGFDGAWMLQALPKSHRSYYRRRMSVLLTPSRHYGTYIFWLPALGTVQASGEHIRDIEDILCDPKNVPTYHQDPVLHNTITRATVGNRQAFSFMVKEILQSHKKQDETDWEAEGWAAHHML